MHSSVQESTTDFDIDMGSLEDEFREAGLYVYHPTEDKAEGNPMLYANHKS